MEDIQSLQAKLKRRDKKIGQLKEQVKTQQQELIEIQFDIDVVECRLNQAKEAMLLFLGLDTLESDFMEKVENEFAVVRKRFC